MTLGQFTTHLSLYLITFILVICLAPFIGSIFIHPAQVIEAMGGHVDQRIASVILDQRIPRIFLGILVGGTLAVTGGIFQVILRNPLAEPYTLGITGGGALGASLTYFLPVLLCSWGPFSSVQAFSLVGSAVVMCVIYVLARQGETISMNTLLLAGVTMGITCASFILLLRYLANPHQLVSIDRWLMGGLDVVGSQAPVALLPLLVPSLALLFYTVPTLNQLALGANLASGQGVDVTRIERYAFLGGGVATATVVSLSGPIGFVGLIVPHIVRKISGFDQRLVIPASFFMGAAFLVACDTMARTLLAPREMPVGVITAMLGGPFFIFLLIKRKGEQL